MPVSCLFLLAIAYLRERNDDVPALLPCIVPGLSGLCNTILLTVLQCAKIWYGIHGKVVVLWQK